MTKRRWRDSIKFFGSHLDPEKDEQLKATKIEMEDKMNEILKLVRDEDLDEKDGIHIDNSKKESLLELIEDFHKQYRSLYSLYDHLTGELRRKVHGKQDKESSSSSSSDSDSDSESDHSSKGKGRKNGKLKNEFRKIKDGVKQELENANLEVADLKTRLTATSEEKEALSSEYLIALSQIKEGETTIKDLKIEIERLDDEKSKLLFENGEMNQKLNIAGETEAKLSKKLEDLSGEKETAMRRIEEGEKITEDLRTLADRLKDEKVTLGLELEAFRGEISDMKQHAESAEQQVADLSHALNATEEENKSLTLKISEVLHEISQAQNAIQGLTAESSQLKERLGEREREFFILTETHQMHGNESSTQIMKLEAHVTGLELELESLRTQKRGMEEQIESRTSEAKQLQARTSEHEMISKEKGDEISVLLKKLENNENDSVSRIENLTARINSLQLDVNSLHTQKSELEEQMVSKSQEAVTQVKDLMDQVSVLQQELESLQGQKTELVLQLGRKSQEISERMTQIENLQQELWSLQTQKNGLELQMERQKEEHSESLCKIDNQKTELTDQITDQQRMLKDQERAFNTLSEENKQLEVLFQECKANLEVAEMKTEEMAEKFHKNIEDKTQTAADLELMVEDLKRDLEEKVDEFNALIEKTRTNEVRLRLSNQKLRVTEQLLTEKEESFRSAELKFQQERRVLEEKITTLYGIIATDNEAHHRMITDISEKVNVTLTGLESVVRKFEEDCGHYDSCMSEISNELRIAKNWFTETNNEKEQLEKKISNLVEQLQNTKVQESVLREKVEKLEVKVRKEEDEKKNLVKAVNQLEKKVGKLEEMVKEKDDGMLGIGEEKREAIRQLCVWIDYHRDRYDYLKDVLSKINVSVRSRTST